MKRVFYQSLDFLLFSNVFIALCAVAQGLFIYNLLGLQSSPLVCGFVFLATLFTYNFCMLVNKPADYLKSKHRRVRWIFTNYRLNTSITLVAGLALIPLFFMLSFASQILVFFLGLVSIAYSIPLFSVDKKVFRLRNISGLKLFLIALVWSFSVVWLPILESGLLIPQREIIILIAKEFVLIAAITLPFDIRDLFDDKASNLKTLPTIFGANNAYILSYLMLLIYIVLWHCLTIKGVFDPHFWSSIASALLASGLIWKSKTSTSEYYYFLFLDGVLIVQLLLLLVFDRI